MSAPASAPARGRRGDGSPAHRRGSLLRAEVARLAARRFVRVVLLLGVLGFVAFSAVAWTQYAPSSPQALARAEEQRDLAVADNERFRQLCLGEQGLADGDPQAEQACGPPLTAEDFPVEGFLESPPFSLTDDLPALAVAVAALTAVVLVLVGATAVGAEWSTRSMVALLFWEPRRWRVIGVKVLVTALAAAFVAALAQAAWLGVGLVLAATRGDPQAVPAGWWGDLLALQARGVVLGVLLALLGFALANLLRNTGAALGVGFAYFAVGETAVRIWRPAWQEWLLTDNAAALLLTGGHTIFVFDEDPSAVDGALFAGPREIVLSNLHGGLVLGGVTALVLAVGAVAFVRRDLQ